MNRPVLAPAFVRAWIIIVAHFEIKKLVALAMISLALAPTTAYAECPSPGVVPTAAKKVEILNALKHSIDREELLRPDFYSQDALKKFFCASNFRLINAGEKKYGDLTGFGLLYETPHRFPGTEIVFSFARQPKVDGWVRLPNLDSALTVASVFSVFGANYTVDPNPYAHDNPWHPRMLLTPTSPFGNQEIRYEFETEHSVSNVDAFIAFDGSIKSLSVEQKEK